MRQFIAIVAVLAMVLAGFNTGEELSQMAVVTSIALDETEGEVSLSCEIGQQTDDRYRAEGQMIHAQAASLPQALEMAARGNNLKLNHVEMLIIGETLFEKGVTQIVDYWINEPQLGLTTTIFIAKEEEAKTSLSSDSFKGEVPGLGLKKLLRQEYERGHAANTSLLELFQEEYVLVPAVHAVEGQVAVDGSAMIQNGKLKGFLQNEETRGVLLMQNTGGKLLFETLDGSVLQLDEYKTELIAHKENETWTVDVELSGEATLLSGKEENANDAIKTMLEQAVKETQKAKADVCHFGRVIQREMPQEFNAIKEEWGNLYASIQTNINVSLSIKKGGV